MAFLLRFGYKQINSKIQQQINQSKKRMSVTIKPISAHLNKGTQFVFFKKSPYVACQLGNQTFYTMPDKNGGQEPTWSQTFTYFNTNPTLRITLMDKKSIGKDQVLGEGTFDMTPAYMNPGVMDRKYVEIKKQGNIFARVYVEILYQGNSMNNMNNAQNNVDYNSMTNMLSSDISNMAQSGIRNNNQNMDNSWGMNNNNQSQYQNNQNQQQMNSTVKPVSPSIYTGSTVNNSNISNTDISQLGMSHMNNAQIPSTSTINSTSRITTIETTRIPTVITMPTATITTVPVPTLTLPPTTVYTTTSLSPRIVTTTTTPIITTTTTTYRNL